MGPYLTRAPLTSSGEKAVMARQRDILDRYNRLPVLPGYNFTVGEWREHLKELAAREQWGMLAHYLKQIEASGNLHRLEMAGEQEKCLDEIEGR